MGAVSSGAVTSRKEWHLDLGRLQKRRERNLQEIIRKSNSQGLGAQLGEGCRDRGSPPGF